MDRFGPARQKVSPSVTAEEEHFTLTRSPAHPLAREPSGLYAFTPKVPSGMASFHSLFKFVLDRPRACGAARHTCSGRKRLDGLAPLRR